MHQDVVALAEHMEWADALAWSTVLQSGPARQDPRVRTWLHHVHTVQRVFLGAWRGLPLQLVDASTFPDLPALAAWGRDGHASIRAFLAAVDEPGLARRIEMPWAARFSQLPPAQVNHPTLQQTVTHLALHTAHHRGQLNVCLRELGAEPPLTDFVAWLWRSQPPPLWPRNVAAPPGAVPERVVSEHD